MQLICSIVLGVMNKDCINNSTESSGGSSQESDLLPQRNSAVRGKGRKRHSYKISRERKLRVDARRIREWCPKKADLETVAQANQRKRPHGCERDRHYFMENARVQDFHPVICLIQTEIQPSSKIYTSS